MPLPFMLLLVAFAVPGGWRRGTLVITGAAAVVDWIDSNG